MASVLIRNAAILTLDSADRFIERGDILVEGSRIAAVGEIDGARKDRVDTVIDGAGFLAAPGLVNAHTHTFSIQQINPFPRLHLIDLKQSPQIQILVQECA